MKTTVLVENAAAMQDLGLQPEHGLTVRFTLHGMIVLYDRGVR